MPIYFGTKLKIYIVHYKLEEYPSMLKLKIKFTHLSLN